MFSRGQAKDKLDYTLASVLIKFNGTMFSSEHYFNSKFNKTIRYIYKNIYPIYHH